MAELDLNNSHAAINSKYHRTSQAITTQRPEEIHIGSKQRQANIRPSKGNIRSSLIQASYTLYSTHPSIAMTFRPEVDRDLIL